MVQMNEQNTQYVINRNERPNSYEVGSAGNRFKIYFEDAEDLKNQLNKLREAGFEI